MSFLNPVNEPVLRFSSTDADAPQINYNARTAGDVKTVIKACLVTGYGAIASAGWSIVNEVDHVAEFVSPSVAMSDYRLGVDDTSASSTTWYYQYLDARVNPEVNVIIKSFNQVNKTSPKNNWQLLVTDRGIFLVETVSTTAGGEYARLTYFGQIKSALPYDSGVNIAFWSAGYDAPRFPYQFFDAKDSVMKHYRLSNLTNLKFSAANLEMLSETNKVFDVSILSVVADLYIRYSGQLVAQQPGITVKTVPDLSGVFETADKDYETRSVLSLFITQSSNQLSVLQGRSANIYIYLDQWEY